MHRTGKVASYTKGCNKQKPSKIIIFCDHLLSKNRRKKLVAEYMEITCKTLAASDSYTDQ